MSEGAVLCLSDLAWQAGSRIPRIDRLEVPTPGVLFLLGSGGVGKTPLLRALVEGRGLTGEVVLDGRPLSALTVRFLEQVGLRRPPPPFPCGGGLGRVETSLDEAERLSRLEAFFKAHADLYLLDEPTAGLQPEVTEQVIAMLTEMASRRALIVATHDRRLPLAIGGIVALLSERGMVASGHAHEFFRHPPNAAARCYVASGGFHDLETVALPRAEGVWWVVPRVLGGMSRPGLSAPLERQLAYLQEHDVRVLFNLEQKLHYDRQQIISAGIGFMHVPIRDMHPPSLTQALAICRSASRVIEEGGAVVFHCRGGLGRTGAALACVLIWHGDTAEQALKRVRKVEPLAVQTEAQVRFLEGFEATVCSWS